MFQKYSLGLLVYVHDIVSMFNLAYFHLSINHSSDDARWWSPSSIQTRLPLHHTDPSFIIQWTCSVADGWKALKWDNEALRKISEASFMLCWGRNDGSALERRYICRRGGRDSLKKRDIFSHLCLLHWINSILTSLSLLVSSLEPWTFICALCVIHPSIRRTQVCDFVTDWRAFSICGR